MKKKWWGYVESVITMVTSRIIAKCRERRKAVRARFIERTIREEVGCRCGEGADDNDWVVMVVMDIIAEGAVLWPEHKLNTKHGKRRAKIHLA